MRRRTAVLGAVLAVGVTCGPVVPVSAVEEPGAGLTSYRLLANAPGIALEGLYRDVALTVPEATSSLSTGGVGTGFASLAWPGPVVGNGGTTLLVLNPSMPSQVTALNSPIRAESHSGGPESATNADVPGTVMTSTATTSKATAGSRSGSGTTLPVGGIDAMTGSSLVELTGATSARSTATTTASGLSFAEGLIRIGSVTSTATATTDGVHAKASGSTVVAGLEVGGVPVTVDGSGLHIAGQAVSNPVAQQTLDSVVGALGLTAVVTTPRTTVQGGEARYDAGAVVLVYTQGSDAYSLTLGRASAAVAAGRGDVGLLPELPGTPVTPPITGSVGGPVTGPPVTAPPLTGSLPEPVVGAGPPPRVDSPRAAVPMTAAALSVALAGGAPAGLLLAVLAAAALVGALLPRLPGALLMTTTAAPCEEQQA